jgi:hypothetical protein
MTFSTVSRRKKTVLSTLLKSAGLTDFDAPNAAITLHILLKHTAGFSARRADIKHRLPPELCFTACGTRS